MGLEVCGFAAIDLEANTALHYFAKQNALDGDQNLTGFYCELLKEKGAELLGTRVDSKLSFYSGMQNSTQD